MKEKYFESFISDIRIREEDNKFIVEYIELDTIDDCLNRWNIMGGSVGYTDSIFNTLEEAEKFVKKGLKEEDKNPDVWLEMLEV